MFEREITPEELEKVLHILPDPIFARFSLHGPFAYSSLSEQVEKIAKGTKPTDFEEVTFRIEKPSKEAILEIYRGGPEVRVSGRYVDLKEVYYDIKYDHPDSDASAVVILSEKEINLSYAGKEPEYVSQLLKALSEAGTNFSVEQKFKFYDKI